MIFIDHGSVRPWVEHRKMGQSLVITPHCSGCTTCESVFYADIDHSLQGHTVLVQPKSKLV